MLFALVANDKPGGLAERLRHRPAHLAHLEGLGETVVYGGPLLDAEGNPNGSLVVIEATDQAAAERIFGTDPYMINGVFADHAIRPFRQVFDNTARG